MVEKIGRWRPWPENTGHDRAKMRSIWSPPCCWETSCCQTGCRSLLCPTRVYNSWRTRLKGLVVRLFSAGEVRLPSDRPTYLSAWEINSFSVPPSPRRTLFCPNWRFYRFNLILQLPSFPHSLLSPPYYVRMSRDRGMILPEDGLSEWFAYTTRSHLRIINSCLLFCGTGSTGTGRRSRNKRGGGGKLISENKISYSPRCFEMFGSEGATNRFCQIEKFVKWEKLIVSAGTFTSSCDFLSCFFMFNKSKYIPGRCNLRWKRVPRQNVIHILTGNSTASVVSFFFSQVHRIIKCQLSN